MGDFTELRVWVMAKDLAVYIYRITDKGLFSKDFGLKDQISRAAASSNPDQPPLANPCQNTLKRLVTL